MSILRFRLVYNFTDLKLKLYESIVKDLISVLGEAGKTTLTCPSESGAWKPTRHWSS